MKAEISGQEHLSASAKVREMERIGGYVPTEKSIAEVQHRLGGQI